MNDEPFAYDNPPEINNYDEIPAFDKEDEEHRFWSTHALGPGLLETMGRATLAERLREIGFKGAPPESPTKRGIAKKRR